ncbi:Oidioi.mRNA.OKI2018_I69.XSR.g15308.t1.cds [Oikopleura dioica]|uniref:Oidioi.mRNA.OKI2018_I69.XSR.g15308.t1.cds n=1 Tax=Oikopleura dioica TaxID=34765 RepID=A0ABN7SE94_OIKDI|nr:Oidioi.mRNA.OKI2018_I69.XSR.g15308.t1.cds [Oikopleura dioica]
MKTSESHQSLILSGTRPPLFPALQAIALLKISTRREMATYDNQESLPYILEAINDLQGRSDSACGSTRPPSTGSAASSVDRDSGNSSIRSFSPDVSSASAQHYSAQLNAAAALWPQAAAAASLAAFLPKQQNQLRMNSVHLLQNAFNVGVPKKHNINFSNDKDIKFERNHFEQQKKNISPIGSGIPKNNYMHSSWIPNARKGAPVKQGASPFMNFIDTRQHQAQRSFQKPFAPKKMHNNAKKSNSNADKQKQGPFNKVLIVGLGPNHRSLPDVVDIFRPYGDVVSARVLPPFQTLPNDITRWVPSVELQGTYCAIVEYPTARCAKFAVGVLRERVVSNKYRVVLLKPGAYDELQRQHQLILGSTCSSTDEKEQQNAEISSDSGNESVEHRSTSDCQSDA